jgi:outer membrane biosynthesis protein TonB
MTSVTGNRYRRERRGKIRVDPGLGRMLLFSLGGHLLLALLVLLTVQSGYRVKPDETYRVDLIALPVANPRAGRPEAAAEPAVKKVPPAPVAQTRATAKPVLPAGKAATKPAVLPAAKGKATPSEDSDYDAAQDRIERLRRRQEMAEIESKIAAMHAAEARRKEQLTTGTTGGTGSDLGVTYKAYIEKSVREVWTLSRYQVTSLDREAVVELSYDAKGRMSGYRFLKDSGDDRFDDSVRRAILDQGPLPTAPGKVFKVTIAFNLKKLLER